LLSLSLPFNKALGSPQVSTSLSFHSASEKVRPQPCCVAVSSETVEFWEVARRDQTVSTRSELTPWSPFSAWLLFEENCLLSLGTGLWSQVPQSRNLHSPNLVLSDGLRSLHSYYSKLEKHHRRACLLSERGPRPHCGAWEAAFTEGASHCLKFIHPSRVLSFISLLLLLLLLLLLW
jgi:hypothetical protein